MKPKRRLFRRQKQLNRSAAGNGLLFTLMFFCGIFMALPLVMIANNALKPLDEIFKYPSQGIFLIPLLSQDLERLVTL